MLVNKLSNWSVVSRQIPVGQEPVDGDFLILDFMTPEFWVVGEDASGALVCSDKILHTDGCRRAVAATLAYDLIGAPSAAYAAYFESQTGDVVDNDSPLTPPF